MDRVGRNHWCRLWICDGYLVRREQAKTFERVVSIINKDGSGIAMGIRLLDPKGS